MSERKVSSTEFPYVQPAGSELDMFIQWKGTDLCADFHCDYDGHLDTDFTYYVQCGGCGAVYEMGLQVIARRVEGSGDDYGAKVFTDEP